MDLSEAAGEPQQWMIAAVTLSKAVTPKCLKAAGNTAGHLQATADHMWSGFERG